MKIKLVAFLLCLWLATCYGQNTTTTTKAANTTTTIAGNTTTTKAAVNISTTTMPATDFPTDPPVPCYFMKDMANNSDFQLLLNQRCRSIFSSMNVFFAGTRTISITDKLCGVRNATSNLTIARSEVCYSAPGLGIAKSFYQTIRIASDSYYSDYADVRNKRFLARKLQIEKEWGNLILTSSNMKAYNFERVTVIQMNQPIVTTTTTLATTTKNSGNTTSGSNSTTTNTTTAMAAGRRKRDASSGLDIVAVVQFGPGGATLNTQTYGQLWSNLSKQNSQLGSISLDNTSYSTQDMPLCPPLKSIINRVPEVLWNTTIPDGNLQLPMGSTFNFICPAGLQLSFDNDNFDPYDNKYTVLCNSQLQIQAPFAESDWPDCVVSCWRKLPPVPQSTGLQPVVPPITVPAGQYGRYLCNDSSFGVNAGSSPYFQVMCLNSTLYNIPATAKDWPICEIRTTTIIPVIPVALETMLSRFIQRLKFRYTLNDWQPGDEKFTPTPLQPYWLTVTIPTAVVLTLTILIILCCTRLDSCLCRTCSGQDDDSIQKTIVPLEEKE